MGTKNVHMQQIEELSSIPSKDVSLLRSLAERYRSLLDPKRDLTLAGLWRDLNDRKPQRPMVWIDEIPWHELGGSGELTSSCCDPIARSWEDSLRKGIYAMKHFPLDAIPSSFFPLPKLYSGGRFALEVQERTLAGSMQMRSPLMSMSARSPMRLMWRLWYSCPLRCITGMRVLLCSSRQEGSSMRSSR